MSRSDCRLPISVDDMSPGMRAAVKRVSPGTTEVQRVIEGEPIGVVLTAAYDDPTQRPCTCGSMPIRDDRHDAYLCLPCDRWIEKKCRDEKCSYCATRPEKPSEVTK